MKQVKIEPDRLRFVKAGKENISIMLQIIHSCLVQINAADYTQREIKALLDGFTAEWLANIIDTRHYYEVWYEGTLVGCGGVSRDESKEKQSYLTAVFVEPRLCGNGIGRRLVEFLETDPWCRDSRLIEVASSKTAHRFYVKCGYRYGDDPPGLPRPDGTILMYKER